MIAVLFVMGLTAGAFVIGFCFSAGAVLGVRAAAQWAGLKPTVGVTVGEIVVKHDGRARG